MRDRNWLEFLAVVDATFSEVASSSVSDADAARAACLEHMSKTREFLYQVAEEDGLQDRAGLLALLELEKRARFYGLTPGYFVFGPSLEHSLTHP